MHLPSVGRGLGLALLSASVLGVEARAFGSRLDRREADQPGGRVRRPREFGSPDLHKRADEDGGQFDLAGFVDALLGPFGQLGRAASQSIQNADCNLPLAPLPSVMQCTT